MKIKLLSFAAILAMFFSLAFIFPENSLAGCRPKNEWTGLCDVGVECSSGACCDTTNECQTTNPPTQTTQAGGQNQKPAAADIHGDCGKNAVSTAIGCINVLGGQSQFLGDILRWAVGVGGGIAFLLIVYAGFMIMTAAGNPERLKAGQELLTSAISGLILLIFSVFVLRFIGIDILGLGQFGFGSQ